MNVTWTRGYNVSWTKPQVVWGVIYLTSNVTLTSIILATKMFTKIIIISILAGLISLFVAKNEFCLKFLRKILLPNTGKGERLFNKEELREYNGIETPELYLVILGKVYNVTSGWKHYGPNGAYHSFVGNFKTGWCFLFNNNTFFFKSGQDASRSFVTGKFEKTQISDDVSNLTNQELRSLNNWVKFYKREYSFVGKRKQANLIL